jgi:hypothetical protein
LQGFAAFVNVVKGIDIARQINASSGDAAAGEGYAAGQILVTSITIIAVSVK